MARRSTGQVVTRKTKRGTVYALRFYAGGERHYVTLGTSEEGWNRRGAEDELAATMAAVRAGTWEPPKPTAPVERTREPTFHEFASEWFEANRHGWAERTVADYRWALSYHLLPHFAKHRLTAITVEEVDRYKAAKLREGKLAPAQINKTLKRLSQILEVAEEYGAHRPQPGRSKRRRVKVSKVQRSWVEPEQALALLDGASAYMRARGRDAARRRLYGSARPSPSTGGTSTSPPARSASVGQRRMRAASAKWTSPAVWSMSWRSGRCEAPTCWRSGRRRIPARASRCSSAPMRGAYAASQPPTWPGA